MQQLFDHAIGEPPPSRVDIPAIMRGRRRRGAARRGAAIMASVAAVAVAIGGAVVFARTEARPRASVDTPAARPSAPPSSSAPAGRGPTYTSVSAAWQAATRRVMPTATYRERRRGGPTEGDSFAPATGPLPPINTGVDTFHVNVLIEIGGVLGNLGVTVTPRAPGPECRVDAAGVLSCVDDTSCAPKYRFIPWSVCEPVTVPGGGVLMRRSGSHHVDGYTLPYSEAMIELFSADGRTAVLVKVTNVPGMGGTQPVSPRLPLTLDELQAIALEPGFLG
jgi:hypothetical protein